VSVGWVGPALDENQDRFPPCIGREAAAVEITGKLTGTFLDSGKKPAISAQIPQFCFWSRELAGNFQLLSQIV
jgi:hypothetical protein